MKFTISSDELRNHLSMISGVVSTNPVLPILEDFLFTIEGGTLTIVGNDLETSISVKLNVNADADGSVAIPARTLLDTLKALPTQPVTFNINPDNYAVEITSAFGKYKLAGENGSDFPPVKMADDVDSVEIPANLLLKGITRTAFATSGDELRPAMTGVLFQIDLDGVTFVATDAHKLVRYTFNSVTPNVSTAFIVPKKALNLLKNSLPVSDDKVKMSFNKSFVFFEFDNLNLVCRLIDARYPDYNAVIPTQNPFRLTITRTDLLNSLKRIAIYANKTTNQVLLSIAENSLTISSQDLDFSNEAVEQLTGHYEGDPMNIGFNAKFLIEMLGVLETDQVVFEMSAPSRASLLLPAEQNAGEDLLMLVMPVMMNN